LWAATSRLRVFRFRSVEGTHRLHPQDSSYMKTFCTDGRVPPKSPEPLIQESRRAETPKLNSFFYLGKGKFVSPYATYAEIGGRGILLLINEKLSDNGTDLQCLTS